MLALVLVLVALDVCTCPVSCTTWQTGHVVQKSPERVVTLNQGTLEILLALGFHFVMVGTAYIDDYIWPQYATEYASIPALGGPSYPNESVTMSVKPDFVVASYKCASHETYVDSRGRTRGIFSNDTIYPCIGKASEWEEGSRFIQIPFRATTLGPRNGTAAVDIAVASLHVRVGSLMAVRKSGVGSFNPSFIENYVEGLACSADEDCIVHTDAAPSSTPGPTPSPTPAPTPSPKPAPTLASTPSPTPAPTPTPIATAEDDVLSGHPPIQSAHWPWALALVLAWSSLF